MTPGSESKATSFCMKKKCTYTKLKKQQHKNMKTVIHKRFVSHSKPNTVMCMTYTIVANPPVSSCRSGSRAGNQCCYRRGNLCTEPECGGTTDSVSPRDWFSLLEHVQEDVLPAIYCCTNVSCDCDLYYEKRPIDDGSRSPPPPPPPGTYARA